MLITPAQEPKENTGTLGYRGATAWTGDQGRAESLETRVQTGEEGRWVRRVHLDSPEFWDSMASPVLQGHRVSEGSEVNLDRKDSLARMDFTEARGPPEAGGPWGGKEPTDRRANQEIQEARGSWGPMGPEACRVRTVKTGMDLQGRTEEREILVSLVTPG